MTAAASAEVERAWERYLSDTRFVLGPNYVQIEEWAWQRLQEILKTAGKKKRVKH